MRRGLLVRAHAAAAGSVSWAGRAKRPNVRSAGKASPSPLCCPSTTSDSACNVSPTWRAELTPRSGRFRAICGNRIRPHAHQRHRRQIERCSVEIARLCLVRQPWRAARCSLSRCSPSPASALKRQPASSFAPRSRSPRAVRVGNGHSAKTDVGRLRHEHVRRCPAEVSGRQLRLVCARGYRHELVQRPSKRLGRCRLTSADDAGLPLQQPRRYFAPLGCLCGVGG